MSFDLCPDLDLTYDLELQMLSMDEVRLDESFRLPPRAARCSPNCPLSCNSGMPGPIATKFGVRLEIN